MIKICSLLIILFINISVYAQIDIIFHQDKIKQGSLISVRFVTTEEIAKKINSAPIKGQTISDTLYIQSIDPLVKNEADEKFSAKALIVVVKPNLSRQMKINLAGEEINLNANTLVVIPTDSSEGFVFGDFEIPIKKKYLITILFGLAFFLLCYFTYFFWRSYRLKKIRKDKLVAMKNHILNIESYDEIVSLWQNKQDYLATFPHLESSFKDFEKVLFKYLFKPGQTEEEKLEIRKAYKKFTSDISGGFYGI